MEQFYENRTTYDPAKDPVAVVTFQFECNPKAVQAVVDAVKTTINGTSVYSAAFESRQLPKVIAKPQGNEHAKQSIQQHRTSETDGRDSQGSEARNGRGSVAEHDGAELARSPRKNRP